VRLRRRTVVGVTMLSTVLYVVLAATGEAPFSAAPDLPSLPGVSVATRPQATPARPATTAASPVASPRPVPTSPPGQPAIVAVGSLGDRKVTLIDTTLAKVTGSVDAGIGVQSMALMPDGQTLWAFSNRPTDADFTSINLPKAVRTTTHRLHDDPIAAAFSSDGRRAFVALGGGNESPPLASTVLFMDAQNGSELGHVDVGQESPGVQIERRLSAIAVARGPNGDVVYVAAHASGTVWALDAASGTLLQHIETGGGPIVILPDPAQQRVYVVADTTNELVAIDTRDQSIANRLTLPARPSGAALAANGALYVSGAEAGQLWQVDLGNWRVGAPIRVGSRPAGLAVNADGTRAYVALSGQDSLAVVDLTFRGVLATIPTGKTPTAVLLASGVSVASTPATPAPAPKLAASPVALVSPTAVPRIGEEKDHLPSGTTSEQFMPADFPVSIAFAPDGRLFYNELHSGRIRVVQNGQLLPDPFFEFKVSGEPEAGLIGLVLDPHFADNHYVYVFYTSVPDGQDTGGSNGPNQLVRLTDVDSVGTELTPIVRDLPSGPIHNSGTLRFGPDGKLYVSLGDNDQGSNAQDLGTLAGKILRFNADGSVPDDNPFYGQHGKQGAIWAYGLRNPFSFDFDPIGHHLFATVNGPGDNDELDLIHRGANYGWPPGGYKHTPGITDPIAVFNPTIGPTGALFYTGDQVPSWKYDWFFCNYHQGQLRRVHLAPESRDRVVFEEVVKTGCDLNLANGPDGALYYTDPKGIYRIHASGAVGLVPLPAVVANAAPTPTPEALPAGTRAEDRDIDVTLNEWTLEPSRARVPTGQIRFVAENTGVTPHVLRIVGQGVDISTPDVVPGKSSLIQVELPPGSYQLVCPLPGHEEHGMSASLTVVGQ
jgi:YVTN family beta-propeller protein